MKNIVINYKESFVNTTKGFGALILVLGVIASTMLLFSGLENENDNSVVTAFGIFLSSFFIHVLLKAVSVILKHLLYIRSYFESKAFDEEMIFVEKED